jgi:integral membrane protein
MPAGRRSTPAARRSRLEAALTRYRILAYVVGTGLVILVLVAVPLKYFAGSPTLVEIVGPLHGFLYLAYVLAALDLAVRARWSPIRALLVLAAGTIPFVSFIAERKVTADMRRSSRV